MSTKHLSQLPQLFRSPFLRKVALGHYYRELAERLETASLSHLLQLRLSEIFESIYDILLKSYRCEYIFKNALTKNWFLSSHSKDTSFVTDEFRVGDSRVDLAVFSKTSVAFEIKTEFDSPTRLPSQSLAYMKVFDLVYIVTTSTMLPKLEDWIPKTIGVLELHDSGHFKTVRPSESHANQTNLIAGYNCLRQSERISIAEQVSKQKVEVPNSRIYKECKKKFHTLLPFEAQAHIVQQIRSRSYPAASIALMNEVPKSLKHAALTLRATNQEMKRISEELNMIPRIKNQKKQVETNEHIFSIPEREARGVVCASGTR